MVKGETVLTASELKVLLRTHGLRLTKRLGQHHLIDASVIQRIVQACDVTTQETVVELGAGLGALTEPLAARAARVIAIEIDRRVCEQLSQRLAHQSRVNVVCADLLQLLWPQAEPVVVVGAIPYHITSPILVRLCEQRQFIQRAILVIQREVAQRLCATPGTKAYGRLSVLGQYGWRITPLFTVPRSAFFPQPEVDSTCVRFVPHAAAPIRVVEEPFFFEIVKAAFAHRRKTLLNCLSDFDHPGRLSHSQIRQLLQALGVPTSVRGEQLSLAQFALLTNLIGSRRLPTPAGEKIILTPP